MGYYNPDKIQKALDAQHRETLAELAKADWKPTPDGYFRLDLTPPQAMKAGNLLSTALNSEGLDLDMSRLRKLGVHVGVDARVRQMLVTEYAIDSAAEHPKGSDRVAVGSYLKLDADQLAALGINVTPDRLQASGVSSDNVQHR